MPNTDVKALLAMSKHHLQRAVTQVIEQGSQLSHVYAVLLEPKMQGRAPVWMHTCSNASLKSGT